MFALIPTASAEFLASIGDLSSFLTLREGTEQALQRVTDMAAAVMPAADGVGITLVEWGAPHDPPQMRTAAYSDGWVRLIDIDQYAAEEGPCIDALLLGEMVNLRSVTDRPRYPNFCARAVRHGLASVLGVPLRVNNRPVGAMNLYSRTPDAFDDAAQVIAANYAAHASVALMNIDLYEGARTLSDQLSAAMESRAIIEQAKGVLMAQNHYSADEAFASMKKCSQDGNIKLRDVAHAVVEEGATKK